MARDYKANRRSAPPIEEILSQRTAEIGFAEIAARYGVDRRTVYQAVDRAADLGRVPPVMVLVLFPTDGVAARRLLTRIKSAKANGVEVLGWDILERARGQGQQPAQTPKVREPEIIRRLFGGVAGTKTYAERLRDLSSEQT